MGERESREEFEARGRKFVVEAMQLALSAHGDDADKSGLPYAWHPFKVAARVGIRDWIGQATALLHDVLEDTDATEADLLASLSVIDEQWAAEVVEAVKALTRNEGEEYLHYIMRCCQNWVATRVKFADLTENIRRSPVRGLPEKKMKRMRRKYLEAYGLVRAESIRHKKAISEDRRRRTEANRKARESGGE